jgi:hypothetical protein
MIRVRSNCHRSILAMRPLMLCLTLLALWNIGLAAAYAGTTSAASETTAADLRISGDKDFHYNNRQTTPFGPAAADILTKATNFLSCKPPTVDSFAYALCYYSGPAVATGNPGNPALPCTLSGDGKSANCLCYKMAATQYPNSPYLVDINAILNLDVYLDTVKTCGHDGKNCGRQSTATPPACTAINDGTMMPKGSLISVFSTKKTANYSTPNNKSSTSCTKGKYAGCMTAPCHDTGQTDGAGNALVSCRCPVYDGPFEIGQADVPCNANALTPAWTAATGKKEIYVWSAGHNPKTNPVKPDNGKSQ